VQDFFHIHIDISFQLTVIETKKAPKWYIKYLQTSDPIRMRLTQLSPSYWSMIWPWMNEVCQFTVQVKGLVTSKRLLILKYRMTRCVDDGTRWKRMFTEFCFEESQSRCIFDWDWTLSHACHNRMSRACKLVETEKIVQKNERLKFRFGDISAVRTTTSKRQSTRREIVENETASILLRQSLYPRRTK